MNIMDHAEHLLQYDGLLHWCFLIALVGFIASLVWVLIRVLLPLQYLVSLAEMIDEGDFSRFSQPIGGIVEIDRLRIRLDKMLSQIKVGQEREVAYRNTLADSQEHERMRIAHEIHDDTIQSLIVVSHHIERAARSSDVAKHEWQQHLKNARDQLLGSIDRLRQLIANLRPSILDELGLVTAVESLCDAHTNLDFQVVGDACEIHQAQELALFRAAQEAIRNADRHAQAHQISASLVYSKHEVTLKVSDDGIGFKIPKQMQEFAVNGHYGLLGIRERVRHLGGQLKLISQLDMGTSIEITFPYPSVHNLR
jgi:signal transduction histidine kinase